MAVKGTTFGPFEEKRVGVGEQADTITFLTQATDSIKVALRHLLEIAEPRIEALLVRERFSDESAQLGNKLLRRNLSALQLPEDALLCPMIDARRMEVYAAVYDRALNAVREIQADIVDENSYAEFLDKQPVYFFGNGSQKCKDKIKHPNAHFVDGIKPLAKYMQPLAELAMAKQDFKDVAYFEPFYLKEFVASTPKKLL